MFINNFSGFETKVTTFKYKNNNYLKFKGLGTGAGVGEAVAGEEAGIHLSGSTKAAIIIGSVLASPFLLWTGLAGFAGIRYVYRLFFHYQNYQNYQNHQQQQLSVEQHRYSIV